MGRGEHNLKRSEEDRDSGSRPPLEVVPAMGAAESGPSDSGVRSMCPFCGSSNPTPEYFCCADWFAMMYPASDTEDTGIRRPAWLALPSLESVRGRLRKGSHLLVTLLASAIVAVLSSLATQWRISERPEIPIQPLRASQPIVEPASTNSAVEVASALPSAALPAAPPDVVTGSAGQPAPSAAAPVADDEPIAGQPQEPSAPRVEPEPAAATTEAAPSAVPAPQPPPAEVAGVKIEPAAPAVKPVHVAPSRGVKVAEPVPKAAARSPAPQPEEPEPVVASPASPPDSEVVRRAAQETATVWWKESSPIARRFESTDSSHWHSLRRGMSRDAVRRLLGEPKWKRHLVGTEVWLYEENTLYSDGWVSFADPGEELTGWRGTTSTR